MSLKLLYLNVKDKNALYPTTSGVSVDNSLLRWDGTNAKMVQGSLVTVTDNGDMKLPATATLGLQLYNTTDQTTNYERLELIWNSNVATFRSVSGGTSLARDVAISATTGGTFTISRLNAMSNGGFMFAGVSSNNTAAKTALFTSTNIATSGTILGLSLSLTYNQASGAAANTDFKIARIETNVGSGLQYFLQCFSGAAGTTEKFSVKTTGLISQLGGVATAGFGTPAIYASGRSTAQSGAVASVAAYTNGAADGSFDVTPNINVTAAVTATITCTVTYTDENNTSRTLTFSFVQNGVPTPIQTITNVTGVGAYSGIPLRIRSKASTSITVATVGTFTSVTYNVEADITQVS